MTLSMKRERERERAGARQDMVYNKTAPKFVQLIQGDRHK